MKKKLFPLLIALLLSGMIKSYSQDSCKVLKPEIAGKYLGGCKNGLANGQGVAQGTDKYDGKFKSGLPSGKGTYTWANGDTWDGSWKNGLRQGEGTYTFKTNGKDSILKGIWENDIFIKKIIPPPYKVYMTRDIGNYSVSKTGEGNKVSLKIQQMGMQNTDLTDFIFNADNGSYQAVGNKYVYSQVVFPVKIKISYTTKNKLKTIDISSSMELIITDPGEWEIVINN
jgi:hypothetical protein